MKSCREKWMSGFCTGLNGTKNGNREMFVIKGWFGHGGMVFRYMPGALDFLNPIAIGWDLL